jgi:hypothetical protein
MKKILPAGIAAVLAVFAVIQLVPRPPRDNPPPRAPARFPADVKTVMRASCMDCHSNETRWPWYSSVAPMSWYVVRDVIEARSRLNFSDWEMLPVETRLDVLARMWDDVVERKMPHKPYALVHPAMELTVEERKIIRDWISSEVEDLAGRASTGEG